MNPDENLWRLDLELIRDRLESLEMQHYKTVESLRLQIEALEARIAGSSRVTEPAEVDEVLLEPDVPEPEDIAPPPPLPPPLPQPVLTASSVEKALDKTEPDEPLRAPLNSSSGASGWSVSTTK